MSEVGGGGGVLQSPQGEKEAAKPRQNKTQRKGGRRFGWSGHAGTPIPKADRGTLPRQPIPGSWGTA